MHNLLKTADNNKTDDFGQKKLRWIVSNYMKHYKSHEITPSSSADSKKSNKRKSSVLKTSNFSAKKKKINSDKKEQVPDSKRDKDQQPSDDNKSADEDLTELSQESEIRSKTRKGSQLGNFHMLAKFYFLFDFVSSFAIEIIYQ